MKVEIIAVGNEVLKGHTINTNAAYIAREIQRIGMMVHYHTVVGDQGEILKGVLLNAMKRVDVILCIGGLGPTEDDLTKEAVCEVLGFECEMFEHIVEDMRQYFAKTGRVMPDNNVKQAYFPKEAIIIQNHNGTAPGCILEKEGKKVILLPGPPKELIPMMKETVLPYLEGPQEEIYETLDIKLFGIGESHMADQIKDLLGRSGQVEMAPYVGNHEVILRISGRGKERALILEEIENLKNEVLKRLGSHVVGYNEDKLEEQVVKLLAKKGYTVSTAESCTGGLAASGLVSCSGVSQYFKEGIVTYSNEAKMKYLGVSQEILTQWGAVSEQTAKAMAEGIRKQAKAEIGLATTGIAGPDGGTEKKPVGLVYIGIAMPNGTFVKELRLQGSRQDIREKATKHLLYELYLLLKS